VQDSIEATGYEPCYIKVVKTTNKDIYMGLMRVVPCYYPKFLGVMSMNQGRRCREEKFYSVRNNCHVVDEKGREHKPNDAKPVHKHLVTLWEMEEVLSRPKSVFVNLRKRK